ncbi:putative membrane protein [Deinococcus sp. HSC-46F16]|uniref:carotenoid biosynthesis protein n=1 Tax=Deinococcus sp. HSC-46F16 TaxID=2910968 RepID=UPI00273A705F|nr:carotenoid biosynthesis protein [Deinococcus sp. HSC-46F16]MCP2015338.1 putative membrane protein [Deinococcus sp. HSC-46F16]
MTLRLSPTVRRFGLAFTALGVAFLGALLVLRGMAVGWGMIAVAFPASLGLALAGDALGVDFAGTLRTRWAALSAQMRPWMWWLVAYVALKIPVPLWPEGFPVLGLLSTAALCVAGWLYAAERVGARRAWAMAALSFGVGWGVELLGSRTGFPFGIYSYGTAPPPTLLTVPLIVPLGWFALTLAATRLAGGRAWLAGVLMVAWDVGLEPLMTAQRYWLWSDPAPLWAGAPLQNFVGWWVVGTGLAWAFTRIAPSLFGRTGRGWGWPMQVRAAGRVSVGFRAEAVRVEPAPRPDLSRLSFAAAYPTELFFLPGGLVLVGRYVEAGGTLVAMLAALALARAVRGRGTGGRA